MNKDIMAKHIERVATLENLRNGHINQEMAALQLNLSVRQIRRIHKKYTEGGAIKLFHQNMGRPNSRKISSEIEQKAMAWIRLNGSDFGPTFAQEKLIEYLDISVSIGTVRGWLIKNGILKTRRKPNRQQFERRKRKAFVSAVPIK